MRSEWGFECQRGWKLGCGSDSVSDEGMKVRCTQVWTAFISANSQMEEGVSIHKILSLGMEVQCKWCRNVASVVLPSDLVALKFTVY